MRCERAILAILLLAGGGPFATAAQPLRLKSGQLPPNELVGPSSDEPDTATVRRMVQPGFRHVIIQFAHDPTEEDRAALAARGARILNDIPDFAVLAAAPQPLDLTGLDVVYLGALRAVDKWSPLLTAGASAVVEFYRDVTDAVARQTVLEEGLELIENPDLAPHDLTVRGPLALLQSLAAREEVARIFPAANELVLGDRVVACGAGAVAANLATSVGDGWDGPGLGAAALTYFYGPMPDALDAGAVQAELRRAFAMWSGAVQVQFIQGFTPNIERQVDIGWYRGKHNDSFAFDGPGGVLAHSFYPPPNPETLAGDLHFDADDPWKIGADVDIFSIALHEMGHILGLGHNDDPNSVMYPYYRRYSGLQPADILEIRKLYAAVTPTTPPIPPATPVEPAPPSDADTTAPSITITSPGSAVFSTSAASITVRGIAADNTGVTLVTWSRTGGVAGNAVGTTAFSAGPIPLFTGTNTVTIRAFDAAGNQSWRTVSITRR